MMELLFLLGWTGAFAWAFFIVWRKMISRRRLYALLLLNLVFLAGLFYFYPAPGRIDSSVTGRNQAASREAAF